MATFAKKLVAIVLALCLGMSMGLQAIAATTTETNTETTVEGGITTTVTTTTETTTEDGSTKVVVTVKTEKEGVDENGVSVKSEETRTDTTVDTVTEDGTAHTEQWKVEGEETKWEKDPEQTEDDSDEANQPKVEVDLTPGDKTVGFGGEVVTGSNTETDENGVTTTETTSTADRVVEAETSEIVTESTAVSSDMHSNIDIGVDYDMFNQNGVGWNYHLMLDENGNFIKIGESEFNSNFFAGNSAFY